MRILSERLAFWFLRLNGFLTIPNFVVHPDGPNDVGAYPQQTDVDVLGVRFPHRAENRLRPMPDFELFTREQRPLVVLSEVKTRQCGLNGPWTDPARENMQKVLLGGGFRPSEQVEEIAQSLYRAGLWQDKELCIRIVCFGERWNGGLHRSHPDVPQLLWKTDVLPFVFQRFDQYGLEKKMHHQWDEDAKRLFEVAAAMRGADSKQFADAIDVVGELQPES